MENVRAVPIIVIFVIGLFVAGTYGVGNLLCRQATRICSATDPCPNNTICLQLPSKQYRCAAKFCPTVLSQTNQAFTFWDTQIVQRTENWYLATYNWMWGFWGKK